MCPPSTSRQSDSQRDHLHQALIDAGVSEYHLDSRDMTGGNTQVDKQRCEWYQDRYAEHYGLTPNDLLFLDVLADLHIDGEVSYHQDGRQHYHTILEGHSWLESYVEPNISELMSAGLLRYPKIDGEERKRINHRVYYELTPSAKHILHREWSGEGVGEEGEGLVHRLGVWLAYLWLREKYCKEKNAYPGAKMQSVKQYHTYEGNELDLAVVYEGITGPAFDGPTTAVEVESDSKHYSSTEADMYKMANSCRDTMWVFPTREVMADVVNEFIVRGIIGLDDLVPDTLPQRGHRDTWNDRLAEADPDSWFGIPHAPMRRAYTYDVLVRDLKEMCPSLFSDTPYSYWYLEESQREESASADSN